MKISKASVTEVTDDSVEEILAAALSGIARYANTTRGARVVRSCKIKDKNIHVRLADKTTITLSLIDEDGALPIMS